MELFLNIVFLEEDGWLTLHILFLLVITLTQVLGFFFLPTAEMSIFASRHFLYRQAAHELQEFPKFTLLVD